MGGSRALSLRASAAERARILEAVAEIARERDLRSMTIDRIIETALVSRRTFDTLFEDCEACVLAAIDRAAAHARRRVRDVYDPHADWPEQIRTGLNALLRLFEEQPALAMLLIVHIQAAGPRALVRRARLLEQLVHILEQGRRGSHLRPPPLIGEVLVGGVLAVIYARLTPRPAPRLTELLNPLMRFIVEPYRGADAACMQLDMPAPQPVPDTSPPPEPSPLDGLDMRLTYTTMRALSAIARHPGISNRHVADQVGITDAGQISRLLHRLAGLGLAENHAQAPKAATKAWRLTARGAEVERHLRPSLPAGDTVAPPLQGPSGSAPADSMSR